MSPKKDSGRFHSGRLDGRIPMRVRLGLASVAAGLVVAGGAAAGPNLVVNGGFESPVISPPYLLDVTPTGWTGLGDMVVQGYAGAVNSGDGNQWWDLNPDTSVGPGISQSISLVAGQTYNFSFEYNGGGGGSTTAISYNIGGDLAGSVSTALLNVYSGSPWQTLHQSFVSSVTGLEILHFMPNGAWSGGFIDNVQLTAAAGGGGGVPEPSVWVMTIMGAGLAGASLRRFRNLPRTS